MKKISVLVSLMAVATEVSGMNNPCEVAQNSHALSKVCLDKMVTVNNLLDDWGSNHPHVVKYTQGTVKIGAGIVRGYFGLVLGQKVVQCIGGKYSGLMWSVISGSTKFAIKTWLLEEGYSKGQVDEYVGALWGLGGKLYAISNTLLVDENCVSTVMSMIDAKSAMTNFLIKQGYSKDGANKFINASFESGRALIKISRFLSRIHGSSNNLKESLKDISESHLEIAPNKGGEPIGTPKKSICQKLKQGWNGISNRVLRDLNRFKQLFSRVQPASIR